MRRGVMLAPSLLVHRVVRPHALCKIQARILSVAGIFGWRLGNVCLVRFHSAEATTACISTAESPQRCRHVALDVGCHLVGCFEPLLIVILGLASFKPDKAYQGFPCQTFKFGGC